MCRIISWDVGIRNLAYCLMEITNKNELNIIKWDVVNLVSDEDGLLCTQKLNNKNLCTKKASYLLESKDNNTIYSCKTHLSQITSIPIDYTCNLQIDKTHICCFVSPRNQTPCNKKSYCIYENKSYCKQHIDQYINNLNKQAIPQKIKKQKITRKDIFDLCHTLVIKLDEITDILTADEVLIENQPTLINPTMKTISAFLYNYFVIRGVVDKKSKQIVKFISPSNKLKVDPDKTIKVLSKSENKTYKLTKQLSIEYTKIILGQQKKWLDHLATHKKKDDLCDSFLQGYYYLCNNGKYKPNLTEQENKS
jgi:hypothetical protein